MINRYLKKTASAILAIALILTAAVPAFADSGSAVAEELVIAEEEVPVPETVEGPESAGETETEIAEESTEGSGEALAPEIDGDDGQIPEQEVTEEPTPSPEPSGEPTPAPTPAVTGPRRTVSGEKIYMVYSDGTHYTGWFTFKSGRKGYCDPKADGAFVTGLKKIGNKTLLFNSYGLLSTVKGVASYGGRKYLLNGKGVVKTGWYKLDEKYKMYFSPSKYYALRDGFKTVKEKRYYFRPDGRVKTVAGVRTINGRKYYSRSDGSLKTGWVKIDDNKKMYFDPDTYRAKKGLQKIGGRTYLFRDNGYLLQTAGTPVYKKAKYWVGKNGALKSGWLTWNSMRLYFDPKTFKAFVNTTKTIDGVRYSFNSDGVATVLNEGTVKVRKYVKELIEQTGGDLYALYRWTIDHLTYVSQPVPVTPPDGYTREEYYLTYAYETHTGNCFNFASVFYWTAKELGLDVRLVEGRVGMRSGNTGPHGWVEVHQNGATYICDPDAEYESREARINCYMVTYESARFTYYPGLPAF